MERRKLLQITTILGLAGSLPRIAMGAAESVNPACHTDSALVPLHVPADKPVPVAFLLSDDAVVIDFAGPWEVFNHASIPGTMQPAFSLYTVAETLKPIRTTGGMQIVPNYSIATAPAPKVLVIPAQSEPSKAVLDWVRRVSSSTDLTMSVCTGAFLLAETGLMSGKTVTTHHSAYTELAMSFPDVFVKRGARFVETGRFASAGGLSSGIDLALRVVERYFGRAVATRIADTLEYQGQGWMNPDSNQKYTQRPVSTAEHPLCAVCDMEVDVGMAPRATYHGQTYFFCMEDHKKLFEANPERVLRLDRQADTNLCV